MPEKVTEVVERVLTLKDTDEPPVDKPFYDHIDLGEGLRKVLIVKEFPRTKTIGNRREIQLVWYEKKHQVGKDILPLVYPIKEVTENTIFEDCLYPVVIWNVSKARLTGECSHIPFAKRFPILDSNGQQVMNRGKPGYAGVIMAFHYVVVNDRYIPNVLPNGKSDDGNFQPGEPIIGRYIKEQLKNMSLEAMSPLVYPRK